MGAVFTNVRAFHEQQIKIARRLLHQLLEEYLHYDQALASGWPIATGVVEGACRHLIGDRFGITGSRWSVEGAEAILRLRAIIDNGDFETSRAFHIRREHDRVHQGRHQGEYDLLV
jgi:hypothetical protein